jgi:hypothetical protein
LNLLRKILTQIRDEFNEGRLQDYGDNHNKDDCEE